MATANQIIELIKTHFDGEDERFKVIALQIAAHEAKLGHINLAREIKELVGKSSFKKSKLLKMNQNSDTLEIKYPTVTLEDLVLDANLKDRIERVLVEYKNREKLSKHGLKNRSKLLLEGEPGTGKTMTASVIANELDLPLFSIQFDRLISKYLGETSAKMKKIFDQVSAIRGVYLFDEFDAIGSDRTLDNDVGEMRRILNSFLQYIEEDDSASIIIAATNNASMLDKALFRRFDDVLSYHLPDEEQISELLKLHLSSHTYSRLFIPSILNEAKGLNHADIVSACEDASKEALLTSQPITVEMLNSYLRERKHLASFRKVR